MPGSLLAAAVTAGVGALSSSNAANKAAKAAKKGGAQANAFLEQGLSESRPVVEQGYDEAMGYVTPYAESGAQYQKIYDDLMGLNGPEARAAAQAIITSDPLWTGQLAQSLKNSDRLLNSRGFLNSGANALASARILNENYQGERNRYQQGGQQGFAAAGAQADLARGKGTDVAGLINTTRGNQANAAMGTAANVAGAHTAGGQMMNNALALGLQTMVPNAQGQSIAGNISSALNKMWGAGASNPAASYSFTGGGLPGFY